MLTKIFLANYGSSGNHWWLVIGYYRSNQPERKDRRSIKYNHHRKRLGQNRYFESNEMLYSLGEAPDDAEIETIRDLEKETRVNEKKSSRKVHLHRPAGKHIWSLPSRWQFWQPAFPSAAWRSWLSRNGFGLWGCSLAQWVWLAYYGASSRCWHSGIKFNWSWSEFGAITVQSFETGIRV